MPSNNWGFQEPYAGNAYVGLTLYFSLTENFREYIEVALTQPLGRDSCYHFQMYVNRHDHCTYSSSDIQIYFSDFAIEGIQHSNPLPYIPQIESNALDPFNEDDWTLIKGDYLAQGGESHLVVGNFKPDALTMIDVPSDISTEDMLFSASVIIDDVSLIKISCSQVDGDGFDSSVDCDDNDPNINPNTVEVCDNIDNNCNNEIDENLLMTFYLDADNDGFGSPNNSILACTQPTNYTANSDDTNANINPIASEILDNEIDEDFNGSDATTECSTINIYPNFTIDWIKK